MSSLPQQIREPSLKCVSRAVSPHVPCYMHTYAQASTYCHTLKPQAHTGGFCLPRRQTSRQGELQLRCRGAPRKPDVLMPPSRTKSLFKLSIWRQHQAPVFKSYWAYMLSPYLTSAVWNFHTANIMCCIPPSAADSGPWRPTLECTCWVSSWQLSTPNQ